MPQEVLRRGPWQVRFQQRGDRYAHQIALLRGEHAIPLLDSVEGQADEDWPSSPALQNLHVEQRGKDQVALLVGMAGRSHWSCSVEVSDEGRLVFDVACRIQQAGAQLASTYALGPQVMLDGSTLYCQAAAIGRMELDQQAQLEPLPEGRVRIAPGNVPEPTATVRWRYALGLL